MDMDIQQGLTDLCLLLHTEFPDSHSEPSLSQVMSFSPYDSLSFIQEKIQQLLSNRPEIDSFTSPNDSKTVHQFEKSLQKLENDIRNHIKIEQQLKLHIEAIESRYEEEIQVKNDLIARYKQIIDQLKGEKTGRERRYAVVNLEEIRGKRGGFATERMEKEGEIEGLVRRIGALERQVEKYKSKFIERDQEFRDISQKLASVRSRKQVKTPRKSIKGENVSETKEGNRCMTPIPTTLGLQHSNSVKKYRSRTRLKHE